MPLVESKQVGNESCCPEKGRELSSGLRVTGLPSGTDSNGLLFAENLDRVMGTFTTERLVGCETS